MGLPKSPQEVRLSSRIQSDRQIHILGDPDTPPDGERQPSHHHVGDTPAFKQPDDLLERFVERAGGPYPVPQGV